MEVKTLTNNNEAARIIYRAFKERNLTFLLHYLHNDLYCFGPKDERCHGKYNYIHKLGLAMSENRKRGFFFDVDLVAKDGNKDIEYVRVRLPEKWDQIYEAKVRDGLIKQIDILRIEDPAPPKEEPFDDSDLGPTPWGVTDGSYNSDDIEGFKKVFLDYFSRENPYIEVAMVTNFEKTPANFSFIVGEGTVFDAIVEKYGGPGLKIKYVTKGEYDKLIEYSEKNHHVPCIVGLTMVHEDNGKDHLHVAILNAKSNISIDFSKYVDQEHNK